MIQQYSLMRTIARQRVCACVGAGMVCRSYVGGWSHRSFQYREHGEHSLQFEDIFY